MQVDFDAVIKNPLGKALTQNMGTAEQPETVPLTLGAVSCEALLSFNPQEQTKQSGQDKANCYKLAMRLVGGGVQDVSAEDIVLLKNKIGEIYAPVVVGRAYDLLEDRVIGEK